MLMYCQIQGGCAVGSVPVALLDILGCRLHSHDPSALDIPPPSHLIGSMVSGI